MTDYERIEKVIRYLKVNHLEQPALSELAEVAQLSEFHFHRLFTRWAGVTPKAFLKFLTSRHAKALLMQSRSLLEASLESGLSGPGRLHDLFVTIDGVTPGEFKARGEDVVIRYGFHESPFGICLIGTTARGICHLSFPDNCAEGTALAELRDAWPRAELHEDSGSTARIAASIFQTERIDRKTNLSVFLVGTSFNLKVWEAVLRIPPGRVLSYKDIAEFIGSPGSSRAVGTALGKNPVVYLIPCHRVIRETGIIGDYHWGRARKRAMLGWESGNNKLRKPGLD